MQKIDIDDTHCKHGDCAISIDIEKFVFKVAKSKYLIRKDTLLSNEQIMLSLKLAVQDMER